METGKVDTVFIYTENGQPVNCSGKPIEIKPMENIKIDDFWPGVNEIFTGTFHMKPRNIKEWFLRLFRPKYFYGEYTRKLLAPNDEPLEFDATWDGHTLHCSRVSTNDKISEYEGTMEKEEAK